MAPSYLQFYPLSKSSSLLSSTTGTDSGETVWRWRRSNWTLSSTLPFHQGLLSHWRGSWPSLPSSLSLRGLFSGSASALWGSVLLYVSSMKHHCNHIVYSIMAFIGTVPGHRLPLSPPLFRPIGTRSEFGAWRGGELTNYNLSYISYTPTTVLIGVKDKDKDGNTIPITGIRRTLIQVPS